MTEIFDIPQDEKHLRVVAHRGTTVFAPENTAASFTCAGERHAWAIETDLRLTSDGEMSAYTTPRPARCSTET